MKADKKTSGSLFSNVKAPLGRIIRKRGGRWIIHRDPLTAWVRIYPLVFLPFLLVACSIMLWNFAENPLAAVVCCLGLTVFILIIPRYADKPIKSEIAVDQKLIIRGERKTSFASVSGVRVDHYSRRFIPFKKNRFWRIGLTSNIGEPDDCILSEHAGFDVIWRAAKDIAHILHVPLLDLASEPAMERAPEELELSLAEMLSRERSRPHSDPAPDGLSVEENSSSISFSWKQNQLQTIAASGLLLVAGLAFLLWLDFSRPQRAFSLKGVMIHVLVLGTIINGLTSGLASHGTHRIVIGPDKLQYHPPRWRKSASITLPELMRIDTNMTESGDLLVIQGKANKIRCRMDKHQAAWIKKRQEAYLGRRSASQPS